VRLIERRRFLIGAGALAAAPLVRGQRRLPVLGILSPNRLPPPTFLANNPFINRLRALGWSDAQTLTIERAYGEGREEALPSLAEALVRKRVDVIWAVGPEAAVAAARATRSIPIVFWGVALPVEQELVDSLARPGRNVTGVSWYQGPGVDMKRLEALREIASAAKRLAHLYVPTAGATVSGQPLRSPGIALFAKAAESLGFHIRRFDVSTEPELKLAFSDILDWNADALTSAATTLTSRERGSIVDFANRNRLPAGYGNKVFAEAGGLISYGATDGSSFPRCAEYVDMILRGAAPIELPVDIPRDYELVLNVKTAKALGLDVPRSLLLRADKVIE
jgi:putative ABC transport system substrate-binding protein